MTKINQTYEQIAKHLTGNMSNKEQDEFEQWLQQASAKEKNLFDATKKLWEKTTPKQQTFNPDAESALIRVKAKQQFRQKTTVSIWKYAAAITLLITSLYSIWFTLYSPEEIIELAQNEVKQIELPDGSTIWMSPGTSITYTDDFINNREVHLTGKAFFEVAKRNGQPFSVFSANTKTQVLGTSFNLETKADGKVDIQVTTGKVAFSEVDDLDPIYLTPGNEANYAPKREQKITTKVLSNENYRAWQTKVLTFSNTPIASLFETLSDYYQTEFTVSENLDKCRFTTSFENQSLNEVIEILEITGNLKITKNELGYQIEGSPCE